MDGKWEKLYNKNGLAAKKIAGRLLSIEPGSRIPRVSDFVTETSLGRGTIQGAFRLLEEIGAIQLEARGHLGTFLVRTDKALLWEIAGLGAVMGAMPLPYSKKYEGLATGLVQAFEDMKVPFNLAFMRGSSNRIEALKAGRYDFAIVSRLAAELAIQESTSIEIVKSFDHHSYVTGHEIFFSDSNETHIKSGMRVGIDYSSADQHLMTEYEVEGIDVDLIEVNYMQLMEMLKNNEIDAAVWNKDEMTLSDGLGKGSFRSEKAVEVSKKVNEACMVLHRDREELSKALGELAVFEVKQIQQQVEEGKVYPRY
ncbi:GntR family transcriptional regulator YhfZ [Guptibacillus algicola]|uniref:GntR family transcriptional regulator YhfZ n=1 Tax=Guptibacillus algicola TaxID=225844 RepID=UPI001CD61271|nr:GntR family transcriptional regulator YhfZ [Alkalihalobacillus algicola]MCA0986942.1 transporter substrate-binding domain-containing protein [Alkalihalobacillus algicola]